MQRETGKFEAQLPPCDSSSSAKRDVFKKATTYLAKIAVVLQSAPDKMLTFPQLMDELSLVISEDRVCVENNIRVCLSSHKCFLKIPVAKGSLNSKRNYWKLDYSQITTKMVRRHFSEILHLFPELSLKVATENQRRPSEKHTTRKPEPDACRAVKHEAKFNSSFSIESLLKRDSPSAGGSRACPLSSVQVRAEQQPQPAHRQAGIKRSFNWDPCESLLHTSAGSSPFCPAGGSTHYGPITTGAARLTRIPVHTEPLFPVYTRASAAPYFTSPHSSYITYSVPAFTHNGLFFSM
ncbi:forkhead box protein H1-like [Melanotaenia boesemani]|uniref:forkhead box protein H1-like n=1 Tax=Melanotaenia boesemani TaxID=1250792 RepID=UPI001C04637F|nr:forkhead box protein H1-like [Melanotaenia boesemani]XP_041822871.1 forkhead box protein H1-like [Melanotaenia boesemani]